MRVAAILLLFLLAGAMARPEVSQLRSLEKRSVDSFLQVRHKRSTDGDDSSGGGSGGAGNNSLSLDAFLGPQLGGNVRQLLGILGLRDISDLPQLITQLTNGTALRPIISLLNSISPTDIRKYLESSNPLEVFIKNIPIIGSLASFVGQLSSLPGNIIDSTVKAIMSVIQSVVKFLTR